MRQSKNNLQQLVITHDALENCRASGNTEWTEKWESVVAEIESIAARLRV